MYEELIIVNVEKAEKENYMTYASKANVLKMKSNERKNGIQETRKGVWYFTKKVPFVS